MFCRILSPAIVVLYAMADLTRRTLRRFQHIRNYLFQREQYSDPWQWKAEYCISRLFLNRLWSDEPQSIDRTIVDFGRSRYGRKIALAVAQREAYLRFENPQYVDIDAPAKLADLPPKKPVASVRSMAKKAAA